MDKHLVTKFHKRLASDMGNQKLHEQMRFNRAKLQKRIDKKHRLQDLKYEFKKQANQIQQNNFLQ